MKKKNSSNEKQNLFPYQSFLGTCNEIWKKKIERVKKKRKKVNIARFFLFVMVVKKLSERKEN